MLADAAGFTGEIIERVTAPNARPMCTGNRRTFVARAQLQLGPQHAIARWQGTLECSGRLGRFVDYWQGLRDPFNATGKYAH